MALDIACGAPTKIDELTSFIMRESERPKVPVASCKTVDRLIKGLELAARARVIKLRGSIDYPVLGRTCPGFPRFSHHRIRSPRAFIGEAKHYNERAFAMAVAAFRWMTATKRSWPGSRATTSRPTACL